MYVDFQDIEVSSDGDVFSCIKCGKKIPNLMTSMLHFEFCPKGSAPPLYDVPCGDPDFLMFESEKKGRPKRTLTSVNTNSIYVRNL